MTAPNDPYRPELYEYSPQRKSAERFAYVCGGAGFVLLALALLWIGRESSESKRGKQACTQCQQLTVEIKNMEQRALDLQTRITAPDAEEHREELKAEYTEFKADLARLRERAETVFAEHRKRRCSWKPEGSR